MNKQAEYLEFSQEIAVIRFIIANVDKLMNKECFLTDIIEEPNRHPHYMSRIATSIRYDKEKKCLIETEYRSGSPSAWNSYEEEVTSIWSLAHNIVVDINCAKALFDSFPEEEISGGYMNIEGF